MQSVMRSMQAWYPGSGAWHRELARVLGAAEAGRSRWNGRRWCSATCTICRRSASACSASHAAGAATGPTGTTEPPRAAPGLAEPPAAPLRRTARRAAIRGPQARPLPGRELPRSADAGMIRV